jgi:hypothetical protein
MKTFYYILEKIINNTTSYNYDFSDYEKFSEYLTTIFKNDLIEGLKENSEINNFFILFIKHIFILKPITKITFILNILKYVFAPTNINTIMLNKFNKIQKVYFAFLKLAYIYKLKKTKCCITHDLYLNPIDIQNTDVIYIYQNNVKYLFTLCDIIHLLTVALTNSEHFFIKPLECKNPYNNIPFSKTILYNIYFTIKHTNLIVPRIIRKFFIENFNLTEFCKYNKTLIQIISIEEHVNNSTTYKLYEYSLIIFNHFNRLFKKEIIIHQEFPKQILCDIMKEYIILYLIYNYSSDQITISTTLYKLTNKMILFYNYNPLFGRKYIKVDTFGSGSSLFYVKKVHFNDDHI